MREDRLIAIAEGLEREKLPFTDEWDFSETIERRKGKECGTRGCAIGQFPGIFPNRWRLRDTGHRWLSIEFLYDECNPESWGSWSFQTISEFLEIDQKEASLLFDVTSCQNHGLTPEDIGCVELTRKATAKEVAANIRAFIAFKKKETV